MINGGVSELACRDRLRSHDINGKNKKEDKRKLNNYEEEEDDDEEEEEEEDDDDEEEDEEERKMLDGAKKKKWKASAAVLEKRTKLPINLEKDDVEVLDGKAKNKGDKRIHGGDDKTTYRKNKKSSSHGSEHKIQIGDHDKDKRRNTLLPLDKNKDSLKEKSRKMSCTHIAEKKLHSCDHHKDMRKSMHSNSKYCERHKKKNKHLSSHNGENKKRVYDYVQHKGRSKPHLFNNNEMQKNEMKKKKKNTPLDLSKENKTQMMTDSKKENKRKKTAEIFDKSKKMRTEDKGENAWSGDRWKMKNTTQGYNKEQKVQSGHKEQRNVIFAFIKIVYNNNFKEFLLIPPAVEPKLKDFTNRRVSLQDSEGNFSSVRLSVVDGYLAFREGWDSFVSDHSIKFGDVLLFEYTARLHFSVRVFGMDSCERVCFSVEMQGGKKQKGCHPPDETDAAKSMNAVSGARPVAVNSKEDPHRVVSWVEHGSSIALSDKDGYLDNGKHTSNAIIQTWTKGTKSSEIILIADDEAPLTQENEDTEKLKTLHAASEMHYVTANTEEDPKGGASGALCGPSVALDNMEGNLAIGECKTNCISSVCSTEETIRSEIIPVTDASPLAQEKDDVAEVTIFPPHIEDTGMTKGSEPEIATPTKCTEIQDSDKDLRRKQEGNTVQLECTTALEKSPNNSKMDANGNVCSKYEAPGGSASLEKWKKATVSGRAALDGTLPVKPEKLLKTEEKLVHNFSSVGGNSFEQSLQGGSPSLDKWNKVTVSGLAALDGTVFIKPEKLPKTEERLVHNVSSVGVNSFEQSLEKWKKTIGSGQAALDGTGLIKPEKLVKTEDKLVSNCSSMGVNSFGQTLQGYAGRASLDVTGLIRPEKQLKTDDKLVGNCSATGVNLVEQSSRRYAGTHSCVQQTPGKISKSTHIKTEIDLLVNGKGPTVQPKTQMDQFEPMGSISCRQQLNNGPVRANHAVARPSEHHSFNQEDRKDSHHVTQAVLLPVKIEVLELDNHSVLKTNLQFCIPSTSQTWLLLPTSLPNALRRKGRLDRNVVVLKDPMKRLWPVFYHENPVFVGFTRGWKPFVAANELRTGDICVLLKDLDEDELVYHVQITRK